MEPLKIFDSLHLEKLPTPWVTSIWHNEFLIFPPIPDDYLLYVESIIGDLDPLLRDIIKVLKTWILENKPTTPDDDVPQESELSWQTLISLEIEPRPLLALLSYLIKTGQDHDDDEDARQRCLLGTSLYLTLLSIPGSSAYQIFHENLFQHALDTLKLSEALISPKKTSKTSHNLDDIFDEVEPTSVLSQSQKKTLTDSLNTIMYDMIVFLEEFSLLELPRSLEAAITSLIDVTKLETDNLQTPKKNSTPSASLATLNHNAYAALTAVCDPRHGPIVITIKLIIKNILTFMTQNCYNNLNTKVLANVRKTTIHFLGTLVNVHQEAAEAGIVILINLIMANSSKIAEDRKKEVSMVIELLKICKSRITKDDICRDVLRLSHHNRITFRIFAQEFINKYLLEVSNDLDSHEGQNLRKILLATVLCHCNDSSSLVRAKCMSTLSEYTKDPENMFLKELFMARDEEADFPSVENLEEAIDNLSDDLDILPDVDSIISMIKDRVEDERAAVRIAAIQVLKNSVVINENILRMTIEIVSERCRDSTMTVRMCAIQVLTYLFESFYDYDNFCTMWVKSVIPQVFDVEINVQIKALEALESLTIKRMSWSGRNDDISWRVLKELSKNKMRKHLAKACDAWTQNGSLTNIIIRSIQSQIGGVHNIEAWILLSAISESQILQDMQHHFKDYEDFLQADDFLEPIFEVLRSCWSTFDHDFLEKMHNVFIKHLNDFQINERLISISLDIVHQISEFIASKGKSVRLFGDEMAELLEISEKIISSMMDHEASETLCRRAIYTLGHASLLCTREPSLEVIRILQGLLIDHDMIPKWIKDSKRLQACAIVVLGQQSMRKETIAHEMMTIFAQLLSSKSSDDDEEDAAIRVNAAKALADVATRFTSLVEPHLPDICVSMKDSNPIVREAIVVIFIQLLVEDYIKVKGSFFFHILTMLADDEITIRDMTIFLIKERLLMKNKEIISQQFLEAIFHYNDFDLKNKFCERKMRDREKMALILKGGDNERKRRLIYDFMWENLEVAGKFKLIRVIITQIFDRFICESFKVGDDGAEGVLRDSLYVVSGDHSLGGGGKGQDGEEEEVEGRVNNSNNLLVEKIKILSVLIHKLGEVRRKVEGSKVVAEVGRTFVKVAGEFSKEQMSELFAEFPDVEGEMEHNIRVYGKKLEVEEKVGNCEGSIREGISMSQSHSLLGDKTPRIVLRRLSSLTYPGLNNSRNSSVMSNRILSSPVVVLTDCVRDIELINMTKSSRNEEREGKRQLK